jgi:adenylyltransferase/sulfurtransferase
VGLTETQIQRYSRHILLPEVGGIGQVRLLESSVLIVSTVKEVGAAAVAGTYLVAGGLGRIGWCTVPSEEEVEDDEEGRNLANLIDIYDPSGSVASVAALNPDTQFEVLEAVDLGSEDFDLLLLFGQGGVLEGIAARFEKGRKSVFRGRKEGWSGTVQFGLESSQLENIMPEGTEESLPAAPPEGVLGAMMASFALRALLGGEGSVGSTAQARFYLSRGRMERVSR